MCVCVCVCLCVFVCVCVCLCVCNYNTHGKTNMQTIRAKHELNDTPNSIRDKMYAHDLQGFSFYKTKCLLHKYNDMHTIKVLHVSIKLTMKYI